MMSDDSLQELHKVWAEVAQMRKDIEKLKEHRSMLKEQADELRDMAEEVRQHGDVMAEKLKTVSEAIDLGVINRIEDGTE